MSPPPSEYCDACASRGLATRLVAGTCPIHRVDARLSESGVSVSWVCRRASDYPVDLLTELITEKGCHAAQCTRCAADIVFHVDSTPPFIRAAPKVCMQCVGITPLPITREDIP
jgi:hypothetical protein